MSYYIMSIFYHNILISYHDMPKLFECFTMIIEKISKKDEGNQECKEKEELHDFLY